MDAIFFDVDGTLWDAVTEIVDSWNETIKKQAPGEAPITKPALQALLGSTMTVIYNSLWGHLPPEERRTLGEKCIEEENLYLAEHPGTFYPGVSETFQKLSEKLPVYIVSNCQTGYIEVCIKAGRLEPFVSGHLCFGDTGLPKSGTIRKLMEMEGLNEIVYVGDTEGDYQACKEADVPFIWASYGFGQAPDAEHSIRSISELPALLEL